MEKRRFVFAGERVVMFQGWESCKPQTPPPPQAPSTWTSKCCLAPHTFSPHTIHCHRHPNVSGELGDKVNYFCVLQAVRAHSWPVTGCLDGPCDYLRNATRAAVAGLEAIGDDGDSKEIHLRDGRCRRCPLEAKSKQTARAAGRAGGRREEGESSGPLCFLPIMKDDEVGSSSLQVQSNTSLSPFCRKASKRKWDRDRGRGNGSGTRRADWTRRYSTVKAESITAEGAKLETEPADMVSCLLPATLRASALRHQSPLADVNGTLRLTGSRA
jgi:hypothetical protein